MALEFTDSNFQTDVMESDKLTIVDFWAEWCGPCRMITPIIEEMAKEHGEKVNIGKVNVDHNPDVSFKFGIRSIPTILFIKNGEVVDKHVGVTTKASLEEKMNNHI